jgi:hypothetical protein
LFLVGGVVSEALYVVGMGLDTATVQYGLSASPGQDVLPPLSVLSGWVAVSGRPALAAMYLGAAAAILTTRALPRWLGWLAAATAALTLVSVAGMWVDGPVAAVIRAVDWLGWGLTLTWGLGTSAVLFLRARARRS